MLRGGFEKKVTGQVISEAAERGRRGEGRAANLAYIVNQKSKY